MLNPSLNRRPASAGLITAVLIAGLCFSLPLAAVGTAGQAGQIAKGRLVAPPPLPPPPPPPPPPPAGRQSQSGFGSLSGTVYDASGSVIPSATVVATNLATNAAQTVATNPSGDFTFLRLLEGDYSLQVDRPGFTTGRIGKIAIAANQSVKHNVSLIVGDVQEKVTVLASGPPRSATLIPPGTPRRVRVGGNVGAMRMLSNVRPVYPASARNDGVEGIVRLQAIVGTDGNVQAIRVLSSIDADLTAAALEAVKQWRYSPTLLNGVPVETLTDIEVEFRLPE